MWARMPITSLVADEVLEEMPERMDTHLATTLGLFLKRTFHNSNG